jgi:NAD-dependent deacetylase
MDSVEQIAALLREARFPVALTGAGISTASGIPDFRTPGTGLWSKVDPAEVASIDAFMTDAVRFWSFYRHRIGSLTAVEPNPAHYALARLEKAGFVKALITQNIDRLHRKAGSSAMVEVHGSIDFCVCLDCGNRYGHDRMEDALVDPEGIPTCDCGRILKPGVVFFGEMLPDDAYGQAVSWAQAADVMLVAGSSLQVWPVAGLPDLTLRGGGRLIILTASETPFDDRATVVEHGPLEEVLPQVADLLGA